MLVSLTKKDVDDCAKIVSIVFKIVERDRLFPLGLKVRHHGLSYFVGDNFCVPCGMISIIPSGKSGRKKQIPISEVICIL